MSISEARWFTDVPPVAPVVAGVSAVARMVSAAGHDLLGAEYLTDACAEGGEWADMCAFDATIGACVPPVPLSTGATAGTPGAWTPTPPASQVPTLQNITSGQVVVTPSPSTPWTTGQYVVTADGTEGYWDGTKWVQGRAPAPPAPVISFILPNSGAVSTVHAMTIDGTGFVVGATVKADAVVVPSTVQSSTYIVIPTWTAPATAGTVMFTVTNPDTQVSAGKSFTVTAAAFDPTNFTIQEVKDHVEALPNNAARIPEIRRILDLERAHKNRGGLVHWLEEQLPYDPTDHTIDEIRDHVEGLPNNADRTPEIQRILDLERANKNRTTLVTWLDEQLGVV